MYSSPAALLLALGLVPAAATAQPEQPPRITFDAAVRRAVEATPTVAEAQQAIRRAEALLADARTVFHPSLDATYGTTVLDEARGFNGMITQPRTQSAFGAVLSYSVLAPSRWAERTQAADQVHVARMSAEETRQDVAVSAARAFLAVIGTRRQLDIAARNRDTAAALAEYARVRLEAGQGSRLNHVRATQELAAS
ncbi:MAG TPA: TolC family protein, partial [Vicinamibacteria bacterium]|nr:TolC family protein [Vicinamibacteria bacterium]